MHIKNYRFTIYEYRCILKKLKNMINVKVIQLEVLNPVNMCEKFT